LSSEKPAFSTPEGVTSPLASKQRREWHAICLSAPLLAFLLSVAYGQANAQRGSAAAYQITELPLRPLAVSNSGWVAGASGDQHAATWNSKAGLYQVPLPPELNFSESTSINSRGEAVGTATTADSSRRVAFILRQNKVAVLPGEQSRANSINEEGWIVGQTVLPGHKTAGPVLWKNGSPIDLKICCAGLARGVNAQGLIVGDTYDKDGRYHAFVWDATHGAHLLSVPGEEYSSALALNGHGDIVLKVTPGGLFLYSGDTMRSVDMPKASPRAMNNNGIVVGSYGPGPEAQSAFVWDQTHGMRDLNALIPAGSGWKLEVASSVNDRGEIVGWGDHGGTENAGFLLRPRGNRDKSHSHAIRTGAGAHPSQN
jgi:probable HAF family extracellular repeat protein